MPLSGQESDGKFYAGEGDGPGTKARESWQKGPSVVQVGALPLRQGGHQDAIPPGSPRPSTASARVLDLLHRVGEPSSVSPGGTLTKALTDHPSVSPVGALQRSLLGAPVEVTKACPAGTTYVADGRQIVAVVRIDGNVAVSR